MGFPGDSAIKNLLYAGDTGSVPELGRSPEEGNGKTLQYSCLETSMDRGAWRATVPGVAKSQTRLSTDESTHLQILLFPFFFPDFLKWKINEGEKHYRITMTLRPQDFLYLRTNAKNTETFVSLKFQYFLHLRTRQCTVITVEAPPTPSSAPVPSTCQRWPSANKYLWQTLPFLSQGFFWEVIPLG